MTKLSLALGLSLLAAPAWAQSYGLCDLDARDIQRDLQLKGNQLTLQERLQAEQRMDRARGLCPTNPGKGSSDLESLRRDLQLQALQPHDPEGRPSRLPGTGYD